MGEEGGQHHYTGCDAWDATPTEFQPGGEGDATIAHAGREGKSCGCLEYIDGGVALGVKGGGGGVVALWVQDWGRSGKKLGKM